MAVTKIFDSVNKFSSRQTDAGDRTIATRNGLCAAISALWCQNVLEGKDDASTKPPYPRAQMLQVKYRWGVGSAEQNYLDLLEWIGLKGEVAFRDLTLGRACAEVGANPGTYHLSILGYHTVAACKKGTQYYFYDCDEAGAGGLYVCDKWLEFKNLAKKHYENERFLGIRVSL